MYRWTGKKYEVDPGVIMGEPVQQWAGLKGRVNHMVRVIYNGEVSTMCGQHFPHRAVERSCEKSVPPLDACSRCSKAAWKQIRTRKGFV